MGYTEPKPLTIRRLLQKKASEIECRDKFADITGDVLLQGRLYFTTTHRISTEEMVSYGEKTTIDRHRELIARELWEETYGQVLRKIQADVSGIKTRSILILGYMTEEKNEVLEMLEKLVEDLNPNFPGGDDDRER